MYDLLLRYSCHIVGEKYVPISHCLLANPGVKKEQLTRVLSHPQALAQCDEYLRKLEVVREAVDDTAGVPSYQLLLFRCMVACNLAVSCTSAVAFQVTVMQASTAPVTAPCVRLLTDLTA